jgi:cell division protein FtsW (lipid II flippase)
VSLILLVFLGVDLVLIAEHNQYAGRPGYNIHRELVYILAGLFLVVTFMIGYDLQYLKTYLKKFSHWIAFLWLILAPLLPWIPDSWDGAYERLVSSLLVVWLSTVSYRLFKLRDTSTKSTRNSSKAHF